MQISTWQRNGVRTALAIGLLIAGGRAAAQSGETFSATASIKSPAGNAALPVTIRIDRFVSDAARQRILKVIDSKDASATHQALAAMEDIGFIEIAKRRTPIKYAFPSPSGAGRVITIATATPVAFVGGAAPDAKPREGFDLALAFLVLNEQGTGDGELVPAAKVKRSDTGGLATDQYSGEVVRLTQVAKAK
jgi:hypothetical protein